MQCKDERSITIEQARLEVQYDPETGHLKPTSGLRRAYRKNDSGYLAFRLSGRICFAHRVAWLLYYGSWPTGFVDHINGDRADNRIANLRLSSPSINAQNQRGPHKDSKSGLLGVCWDKRSRRWKAQITFTQNGARKTTTVGRFQTKEEAHAAYLARKRAIHAGCTI